MSHAVKERSEVDQPATIPSILDSYMSRPTTAQFQNMTLLDFVQHYTVSREPNSGPSKRKKKVVIIVRLDCPTDPQGPKYKQYCLQKLMLHVQFFHHAWQ